MPPDRRQNLTFLVAGLLLLAFAWFDTLEHLATLIWTVSMFSHGVWVPVVSAWLIWREQEKIAVTPFRFWWPGAVGLTVMAGLWLLGGAAEAAILQHVALIGAIQFLVLASLGTALYRVILFPLLFLFAFVPFGDQILAPLQVFTAEMVIWALDVTGVAHQSDGVLIQLSSGLFEVAAACAGVRFLFSSLVTGVLLCHLAFKSWHRRALMIVASAAVPVIANVVRVYGTLLISEATDISFAKDVDHIVYGWGFLSLVLLILIATAYKFSDRDDAASVEDVPDALLVRDGKDNPFSRVAAALGLGAVLFSAWWLPAGAPNAVYCDLEYDIVECVDCGIRRLPGTPQLRWIEAPTADTATAISYRLEADTVFVMSAAYAPDRLGHRLAASTSLVLAPGWNWLSGQDTSSQSVGRAVFEERTLYHDGRKRLVWQSYHVGGRFYSSRLKAKLALAQLRLQGHAAIGQMLVASTEFQSTPEDARVILSKFFGSLNPEQFLIGLDMTGREKNVCAA